MLKSLPDLHEKVASRPARAEMKPQVTSAASEAGSDFEQLKPQSVHLSGGEIGGSEHMEAKQHQQLVSERVELKSKGVGAVAVTGQSVPAKAALVLFDPILALSPLVIEPIDLISPAATIGDDKPNVSSQGSDFNLDQDSSLSVLASGPVAETVEESNRSLGSGIFALGLFYPAPGSFLEHRVGGDANRIEATERFQGSVDFWSG